MNKLLFKKVNLVTSLIIILLAVKAFVIIFGGGA